MSGLSGKNMSLLVKARACEPSLPYTRLRLPSAIRSLSRSQLHRPELGGCAYDGAGGRDKATTTILFFIRMELTNVSIASETEGKLEQVANETLFTSCEPGKCR